MTSNMKDVRGGLKKSDVLIVTNWFPPEPAPFGHMMRELGEYLADKGKRVDVITSCPNHPHGRVYPGWQNRLLQEEWARPGMRVLRVGMLQALPGSEEARRSNWNRSVNFVWFSCASLVVALLRSRPRVVLAVLQPLTISLPLILFSRLCKARLVFNVQDLHPDALISTGVLRNAHAIRVLRALERTAYRSAHALTVISEGFKEHCARHGGETTHVHVIPNWIDLDEIRPQQRSPQLLLALGLGEQSFIVLFAGTIGLASGAEILLDVAEALRNNVDIQFVFVGEGQLVPHLKAEVARRNLSNTRFLPFQPRERVSEVQSIADVSIVTLRAGQGRASVPSKLLGYFAASRPVVAVVEPDCETARMLHASGAGITVPPGDVAGVARAVLALQNDRVRAENMGRQGRAYVERHYSKVGVLARYESVLTGT